MSARNSLIEEHLDKVSIIAALLARKFPRSLQLREEMVQVGRVAMIQAAERYKEDQGPFWPFVKMHVRGAMLDWIGQNWRETFHVERSAVRISTGDPAPEIERNIDIERALKRLAPRERRVFRATRAGHGCHELAGMMRISKGRATRIRQRMEEKMREILVA